MAAVENLIILGVMWYYCGMKVMELINGLHSGVLYVDAQILIIEEGDMITITGQIVRTRF